MEARKDAPTCVSDTGSPTDAQPVPTHRESNDSGPGARKDVRTNVSGPISLWRNIALIAGGFSFVICLLIIVNYLQINRIDPVETKTSDALVGRLSQNPDDAGLREQIRTLDLLSRKAYFTTQWQIRMGGYLLLIGVIITIVAAQMMLSNEKKMVDLKPESKTDLIFLQKRTRRWVTGFSVVLVAVTLVFAYMTYRRLGSRFDTTLAEIAQPRQSPEPASTGKTTSEEITQTPQESTEPTPAETGSVEESLKQTEPGPVEESAEKAKPEVNPVQQQEQAKITETGITASTPEETVSTPKNYSADTPGFNYEVPFSEEVAKNYNAFRGPGSNGIAFNTNIPENWNGETGENIRWKTKIPLQGYNSPVVWNDKIFLTGASKDKREVYCFDSQSGEILWTSAVENIPGSPATAPKVPDYTGYAASTGTTDGKHFYAIFANADVAAFDFDSNRVWGRNLGSPDNHYGYGSSLQLYKGKLIIQWDQQDVHKVMALSTETGETVWETDRNVKISWASPVIASTESGPQLVLAADPLVVAYNPDSGEELWNFNCLSGEVGPSVACNRTMVFALNEYASLVGIKIGSPPEKAWEDYTYLSDVPSPVATDKHLIVSTSYGVVACFTVETGEMIWEAEFDNSIYSSPVIAEGKVYLIDKQGITHIFRPGDEYIHIADCPLGEGSVCTPAFANGRIFIRGYENLYCIGEE